MNPVRNNIVKVIHVIPISRGIGAEQLSYFTSIDAPIGSIVTVPLRKRFARAIIVDKEDIEEAKHEIKRLPFPIKKINDLTVSKFFPAEFIESAKETAEYYATTTGSVIHSLVPNAILENISSIKYAPFTKEPSPQVSEKLVFQANDEERIANYRSLIREEFAKNFSIFICFPTISDAFKAKFSLEKGIENYTFALHGSLKKKEVIDALNKIFEVKHPVLIVGTAPFLCLVRKDLKTIIIEKESSRFYRTIARPYIDMRFFIEKLASKCKAKIIIADTLLRTETIWRVKNEHFAEFAPLKFRAISSAEQIIVDLKKQKIGSGKWSVISEELHQTILQNRLDKSRLFIYAARRGLSPITVCSDCQTVVVCKACVAPVVLHTERNTRFFLCHHCGANRSAMEKCKNCGSWKLSTLGIGIELAEEEIRNKFPEIKIWKIDQDSTKTHKKALEAAEKFYLSPGSILLGTEMALSYLEKIENTAVLSIDSLFSLPDFKISEKIFYILLKIRALARQRFILQTRSPEKTLFDHLIKGNLLEFYREEIEEREKFGYPPFSVIIKITAEGKRVSIEKEMEALEKLFSKYSPLVYDAFIPVVKSHSVMHILIKIPRDKWPHREIFGKLLALSPHLQIRVDPESLL